MYAKLTRAILSALIALAIIVGIVAPAGPAMAARDQWAPQFKSQGPTKAYKVPRAVRNPGNDSDDDDVAAGPDDDDEDDSNELPEWADEAF